ncbi:hypothetical protein BVY01_01850 [bacterium I07]|nr:hypothetical protein BVY01_01850 [bacterium I07]
MSRKSAMIFVGLVLGLGWAIRGHFGHEWGASWAGAMSVLAVLAVTRRKDWSLRWPVLVVMGGVGWGLGGMMSYGIVVGYCRGIEFGNVLYGYAMLAVIGGLYGFIGGGWFGLGLESTEKNKPDWAALLTQMVAGALFFWAVLIPQFEWKMTPPRSELWAACFGAAFALTWYLYRNGYSRALRLAVYSAIGGGFGFAFGNFLQLLGNVSGLSFNWWNVMEFSLGFFGGLGMAYGVLTRQWPETVRPSRVANWLGLIFLFFAIPATNLIHQFDKGHLVEMGERLGYANPHGFAQVQALIAWIVLLVFLIFGILVYRRHQENGQSLRHSIVPLFLYAYTLWYLFYSHMKKGFLYKGSPFQLEQLLYWVVLAVFFVMWLLKGRQDNELLFAVEQKETWKRAWGIGIALIVILVVITLISINIHDGQFGYHERFK